MFQFRGLRLDPAYICIGDDPAYAGPRSIGDIRRIELNPGNMRGSLISRVQAAACAGGQ